MLAKTSSKQSVLFGLMLFFAVVSMIGINTLYREKERGIERFYESKVELVRGDIRESIEHQKEIFELLSISISSNKSIKTALRDRNFDTLGYELDEIKGKFKRDLRYQDIWIQFLSNDFYSVYRSWTSNVGDYLGDIREDLKIISSTLTPTSSISVGKFSMTYKNSAPVFYDGELVGFVEIISPFHHIVRDLNSKHKAQSLVAIDREYKEQLSAPISKIFVNDYNVLVYSDKSFLETASDYFFDNFDNFKRSNSYKLDGDYLVMFETIKSPTNRDMAYIFVGLDMESLKKELDITISGINLLIYFLIFSSLSIFGLLIYSLKSINREISTALELNKKLEYESNTDTLTELKNRKRLLKELDINEDGILAIVNIDKFETINNFYGSKFGDEVIREFAKVLAQFASKNRYSSLYKLNGDEYAIYSPMIIEPEELTKKLLKYIEKRSLHISAYEIDLDLSVSIGVAHGHNSKLLERADMALKSAKVSNEDYRIYNANDKDITKKYKEQIEMAIRLREAIRDDRIVPAFQPIVDRCGNIKKFECLIRMIDENGATISPYQFLDIAKSSKIYPKLTKIMIEKSFEAFSELDFEFSINLSALDIEVHGITTYIEEMLLKYGVRGRVTFEILETESAYNHTLITRFIRRMQFHGVKISIDDFGSGYSNFTNVLLLNPNYLKIDGSLIKDLSQNSNSKILVETILSFSKRLNIETIAEFVASKEISDILIEMGVDYMQGFYYYKPIMDLKESIKDTI